MKRCPKVDRLIEERWLDTHQVSAYTGLSNTTIKRAVCSGVLKVSRVTGKHLFQKRWVDMWLEGK